MSDEFSWLTDDLHGLEEDGLLRGRRCVTPLADGWCRFDGRRLLNCASNDYLGLAGDPRVVAAAKDALDEFGVGSRASALVTGRGDWHVRLEQRLARFEGREATVLFPTGYAANLGTITALAGTDDVLFCDRLNHASLIDGCRLCGAKLRVYPHRDIKTLERELKKSAGYRRRMIVTDSLFSMDADYAPLKELCDLAERYDAAVIVDEAHATGVFGRLGRGIAEWLEVEDRVAVRIGTLSKGVGCLGGFVCGSESLIRWLWNKARPQIFSTALPPAVCAAATAAIDIIESEPERRERLLTVSVQFRTRLWEQLGPSVVPEGVGPIIPVLLNDPRAAVDVAERLRDRGFLVAAIRPPTVPRGTSRLRITLSAVHDESDVMQLADDLLGVLKDVPERVQ